MNEQKHTILREVLEITVPDRANVLPIQNKISEIVKYRLHPKLDQLFSKISSPNEIVRIDKMEIDLGTVSNIAFEEEMVSNVIKQVEEKITKLLIEHKIKAKQSKPDGDFIEKNGLNVLSLQENYLKEFVYFLKNGQLHLNTGDIKNLLDRLFSESLKVDKERLMFELFPLFRNSNIRQRLIYQFNETKIEQLLNRLAGSEFQQFANILIPLETVCVVEQRDKNPFKEAFLSTVTEWLSYNRKLLSDSYSVVFQKELLLLFLSSRNVDFQKETILNSFKKLMAEQKEPTLSNNLIVALLVVAKQLPVNFNDILVKLQSLIRKVETPKSRQLQKIAEMVNQFERMDNKDERTNAEIQILSEPGLNLFDEVLKIEIQNSQLKEKEHTFLNIQPFNSESDSIFISNAGLVILYPFLKYFFDGLGLLNENEQFKSCFDSMKAVHLLQYLVTQNNETPEYELALNKILCGIDLTEPVPLEIALSEYEKEECDNLLKAVLEQWKVLKTTKAEAIRETFLKREGILTYGNRGWNLKVVRNTFDVLLDKLPWGISIIKLPWHPQIIYVEW